MEDASQNNKQKEKRDRRISSVPLLYTAFLTVLIVIIIYLSYFASLPIVRSIKTLTYQFQVDNVEGYLLDQALKLKDGKPIYTSINDYPYLVGTYAPVFPLINAFFLIFSEPTFFFGRLINLIAYLLISFFSGLIVYNHKKKLLASFLTIVIFLSSYSIYIWAPYYRVDFLAMLFGIIGIYVISKSKLNLSLLFFTLAFYTKQTEIAPIIATVIFLFITNYKTALKFIFKLCIIILNIFIILNLLTHNEYAKNAIVYNVNKFSLFDLKVWLRHYFFFYQYLILLVICAALYLLIKIVIKSQKQNKISDNASQQNFSEDKDSNKIQLKRVNPLFLFIIYFVISQLTLISTAKVGSAPNYLIEPILTLAIMIGFIISYTLSILRNRISSTPPLCHSERSEESRIQYLEYIFIILGIIFLISHSQRITIHKRIEWANTTPDYTDNIKGRKILYIISSTDGEIITEDPIYAILSGKEVLFHPFIMTQLSNQKLWDQTQFVNDLKRRRFDFIIATENILDRKIFVDNYTPEMLEAIRQNYSLYRIEPDVAGIDYFILRPTG